MVKRMLGPRRVLALVGACVVIGSMAAPASGTPGDAGFLTSAPSLLLGTKPGVTLLPIITVGDDMPGGYQFEAIPDGVSLRPRGQGRVDLFVNHETSTVPFPYQTSQLSPTPFNSQNDFDNAQLSHLVLSQHTGGVLHASFAIDGSANYQRFCSNFLATEAEGFERDILFTNEEATDFVNRSGLAWPAPTSEPPAEQAGVAVAYDVQTGQYRTIYGMGRFNHENYMAVPGYEDLVMISGDDTFTTVPSQSQVYMYLAGDADAVWNDEGALYAFRSNDPANDEYGDIAPPETVTGEFIPVPPAIAAGPQAGLETWSQANDVFNFIRIEDTAYDRNDPNVIYLADSGLGSAAVPNGRIWRMELDENDPTGVVELSVLIDGDALPLKDPGAIHQPDNLETTANSLFVTEDPSSGNQFNLPTVDPNATSARVWRYDLDTGTKEIVLRVDESSDPSDGASPVRLGNWEASGVVDASSVYGEGYFFVTVQAHSLWVDQAPGLDLTGPAGVPNGVPDWTYKREGGQLLLVHIPGA